MYSVFRHVAPAVRQLAFDKFKAAWLTEARRIYERTGDPPALRFPPLTCPDGVRRSCCPIGVVIMVQEEVEGRGPFLVGLVGSRDVPTWLPGTSDREATDFMVAWDDSVLGSLGQLAEAMGAEDRP